VDRVVRLVDMVDARKILLLVALAAALYILASVAGTGSRTYSPMLILSIPLGPGPILSIPLGVWPEGAVSDCSNRRLEDLGMTLVSMSRRRLGRMAGL
jgi:hypothetical protein